MIRYLDKWLYLVAILVQLRDRVEDAVLIEAAMRWPQSSQHQLMKRLQHGVSDQPHS